MHGETGDDDETAENNEGWEVFQLSLLLLLMTLLLLLLCFHYTFDTACRAAGALCLGGRARPVI